MCIYVYTTHHSTCNIFFCFSYLILILLFIYVGYFRMGCNLQVEFDQKKNIWKNGWHSKNIFRTLVFRMQRVCISINVNNTIQLYGSVHDNWSCFKPNYHRYVLYIVYLHFSSTITRTFYFDYNLNNIRSLRLQVAIYLVKCFRF